MLLREVMKALPKILLALTAVAAFSVAYPAKANLITNGGFETGDFTGWTTSAPSAVVGSTFGVSPHSGNFQAGFGAPSFATQNLTTTPGASYVVDFWVAANVLGGQGTLNVVFASTVFSYLFPASSGYTEYTFTVTASSSTTALQFIFLDIGASNLLLLDDVSVNPAGVPDGGSTVSLLGCALLGLTALRRKLSC
jgi:hypothetical protein